MISSLPTISRRSVVATAFLGPALSPFAWADEAAPVAVLDIKSFFRAPQLSSLRLSPDGRNIAALREYKDRINITVVNVATRKPLIVTSFTDGDVASLSWVNNERLIFTMIDRERGGGDQVGSGLFVIDRDGSNFKSMVERSLLTEGEKLLPAGTSLHGRALAGGLPTDDVVVEVPSFQGKGRFASNLYRLNTATGRSTLMTLGGPANTQSWVIDRSNIVRAATVTVEDTTSVYLRDSEQAPWRVIFKFGPAEPTAAVVPLAFDVAGKLYVSAYAGSDTAAIYGFDAKTGALESQPVFAIKGFDVTGGLRFSPDGARLLGVDYDADRPSTYWIDDALAKVQVLVDQAIPDHVNQLQLPLTNAESLILVSSYSDRDPGRFLLLDRQTNKLEQIAQSRPWMPVERMRPTSFLRYATRDGMLIPAQLTTPVGQGPFPLVVLHYGGPWVRPIEWRWDPHVQFLVSRGYAVFMPAPRASTGFGVKLFKAGWKQWGLGMQDDVTDGVRQLIKDGIADPRRVCIAGASYGGYLTMMGLAKEPSLFRCGINWVGVTDPSFMFSVTWTDFNRVDAARFTLPLLIGDPDKDKEQFKRTSPVERAADITQPVLMAYGGLDNRVPLINGEKMRAALASHNKKVEWVVYADEGHGWLKVANNVDFWTRVEKFLAENMKAIG
ncbi:prolyl oligopeptidase family serine peptidase [Rhodoferax sp.]|uniref:prolyl oligopeptidase family serine peptidase n=1 Tax=Rhodoferax sp. TaxID=50421 RepID=UPI00262D8926|nr:prolyl oligopeptidase family serine peptidase [Rhodoferax sp.]MDD2919181.1 prolyl oligopeptidase family serine peptidase [Rhodoferax sp.]